MWGLDVALKTFKIDKIPYKDIVKHNNTVNRPGF